MPQFIKCDKCNKDSPITACTETQLYGLYSPNLETARVIYMRDIELRLRAKGWYAKADTRKMKIEILCPECFTPGKYKRTALDKF